jgi:hypothetical protein
MFNLGARKFIALFNRNIFLFFFYCLFPQGVKIILQHFCNSCLWLSYKLCSRHRKVESMFLEITFTYTRKSTGPKTLSCCTSKLTLTSLDSCTTILRLCLLPTKKSITQTTTFVCIPQAASFLSSRWQGTTSKALNIYIIMASILTPSSEESAMT